MTKILTGKAAFLALLEAKRKQVADNPAVEAVPELAVVEQKLTAKETAKEDAKLVAKERFLAMLAAKKKQAATTSTSVAPQPSQLVEAIASTVEADDTEPADNFCYYNAEGNLVFGEHTLNDMQMRAVELAKKGESFVLTGAAGTGKTTAQAGVVWALDAAKSFGKHDFKYIGSAPSIALVAFTKVAVRNMQKALRRNTAISSYSNHCMTIHSLLEYEPEYYDVHNDDGEIVEKWGFRPQRNAANPLNITHLVIEEASMVDLTLWAALYEALPTDVQIIFLGDINQLKPVFGDSILAYALNQLEVIELTEVYRQAADSPIIGNAHRVLQGKLPEASKCGKFNIVEGKVQVKVGQDRMANAMAASFEFLMDNDRYDPEQDMILSPWNVRELGTRNMNERIATFLGIKRNAVVHEVRAGRNRWWLAVGDRILADKRLGKITAINPNPKYLGTATAPAGAYSRSGVPLLGLDPDASDFETLADLPDYSDFSLDQIENVEEKVRASSHIVSVVYDDDETGLEHTIENAGQFGDDVFQFGYVLTVHKAQGSEWRRVFMLLHWDHTTVTRESLYTAITRAAEEFTIFGKMALIERAVKQVSLKGTTLQDKIAYFSAGLTYDESIRTTKPSVKLRGQQ